ncbi:MAG: hypothetical protein KKB59_11555 [Spirochaetes bacterium]|nr:hypothetical protein [Spirochaetota bacterium]
MSTTRIRDCSLVALLYSATLLACGSISHDPSFFLDDERIAAEGDTCSYVR